MKDTIKISRRLQIGHYVTGLEISADIYSIISKYGRILLEMLFYE